MDTFSANGDEYHSGKCHDTLKEFKYGEVNDGSFAVASGHDSSTYPGRGRPLISAQIEQACEDLLATTIRVAALQLQIQLNRGPSVRGVLVDSEVRNRIDQPTHACTPVEGN